MNFSASDIEFMQRALVLAKRGRFSTHPNPNVGCVIVSPAGEIVGEGWHERAGEPHAEVFALRAAGAKAQNATVYVTLEPCSHHGRTGPCADALVQAKVKRVVVAMCDPFKEVAGRGLRKLQDAGIEVQVGLLTEQAQWLNRGFLKQCERGLPWVQLKLAASLDGRTALANGESQWITGPLARADVHEGRAMAGAILTGADTVLADNPQLNVRPQTASLRALPNIRQPIRVVMDTQGRLTPDLAIFQDGVPVLLVRTRSLPIAMPAHVEELIVPNKHGKADLRALLIKLSERNIHTLWAECGASLAGALLHEQLVDELILYIAPKVLGADAKPLFNFTGIQHMSHVLEMQLVSQQQLEEDIKLVYTPKSNAPNEEPLE